MKLKINIDKNIKDGIMNKKNIIKFILDVAMAVLFITFFNKNLISFKFHIIGGYVFAAFILVHMILNKKWIINISKRLFDKKLKLRVKISYILSLFLFISIFSIIASGVLMMKATTYDRVMFWKMLHFGASYLSIALIGMHIGLYWNFIMNMFKKIFKIKESNSISKILVNSVVIIVLILGIYTTYRTEYFTKVTNTLTYVAQHIKPQDIEAPEGNGYEKEHLTFTDLSITYGSIISIFAISTYYSDVAIKEYNKSKLTKKDNKKIVEEAQIKMQV